MSPLLRQSGPPRLLVSVRSVEEAASAVAGGVDVLDVKEPADGPLGRADFDVIQAIASDASRRGVQWVTAALGELSEWTGDASIARLNGIVGLSMAKVGLAGEQGRVDWRQRFDRLAASLASTTPLIAAAYADADRAEAPSVAEVVDFACDRRLTFLLIDTWRKDGRRLLDWLDPIRLRQIQTRCASCNVGLALAGSLRLEDLDALADVRPDVAAVRGAVCVAGDRSGSICADRVRRLRDRLRTPLVARTNTRL
jgi:uncharacterized protein (UPF0264 family)